MKKNGICKLVIGLSVLGFLTASSSLYASGYKLEFQSVSVLADAGDAAVVEDAGTNWFNSAGIVYLPQQLVISGIQMYQQSTFSGSAAAPSPFGDGFVGQGSKTSYITPYLPAIHVTRPITDRWFAGISIVPAWGLQEGWSDSNPTFLRYDLIKVYTRTIDVAPSIAFKINDHWSIGAGPDFNYFSVQNSNNVRTQGPAFVGGTTGDSISSVSADNWSKSWHAGLLYRINEATRIGLNYRSKVVMNLRGYSSFGYNGIASYETNDFTFHTMFPPTTALSAYHDVNQRWAVMGTIAYDQWSVLRYNNAQNYQSIGTTLNVALPQLYNNTFDFGVGTHYKVNDDLMLRGSVKYENTPTKNLTRVIQNPDAPKLGLNIGLRYQINKQVALDGIYAHVFTKTVRINSTNQISGDTVNGHVSTSIDLIGAQVVWNI